MIPRCSSTLAPAIPALRQQFVGKRAPYRVYVDSITGHIWQFVLRFLHCGKMGPLNKLEAIAVMAAADILSIEEMGAAAKPYNTDHNGVRAIGLSATRCPELHLGHSQCPRKNRRTRLLNVNNAYAAVDILPSSSSSSSTPATSSSSSDIGTDDALSDLSPDLIKSTLSKLTSCNKDRLTLPTSPSDEVDEVLEVINQATRDNHAKESTINGRSLNVPERPTACKSDSTSTNICKRRRLQPQMRCCANEDCRTKANKMRLMQTRYCLPGHRNSRETSPTQSLVRIPNCQLSKNNSPLSHRAEYFNVLTHLQHFCPARREETKLKTDKTQSRLSVGSYGSDEDLQKEDTKAVDDTNTSSTRIKPERLSHHSIGVYTKLDMTNALVCPPSETTQKNDDTTAQQSTNTNGNAIVPLTYINYWTENSSAGMQWPLQPQRYQPYGRPILQFCICSRNLQIY